MCFDSPDLVPPFIYRKDLTEAEKASVAFIKHAVGKDSIDRLGYDDFIRFLEVNDIDADSLRAAEIETGFPVDVKEGRVRWERVGPAEWYMRS